MAEEKEIILIEVQFDSKKAEQEAARLTGVISACKKELADTHKEFREGKITQDEYNKSIGAIVPQLNKAEQQYKAIAKATSDYNRLQAEQAGSMKQQAISIELLTDKLRGRNAAYLDSKAGKQEIANLQQLKKEYDDNSDKITKTKKSVSDLIKEQSILGVNIGQVSDSFKNGTSGVGTFTKAIFTTRGALVALAAVPIVLALTAVIAFFKATDEGSDRLAQGLAFLTAGFDSLLKGIAPVGKLLVDLFSSPIDTIKKITKGTDDYNVSLKGIARSAYEAAEAHRLYTKRMQDVEDNENALIAQRERVGLQVDQAILKAKDLSLTHKQRIDILREAGKAEAELAAQVKKNAFDAYVAKLAENITIQRSRKLTDDELKAQLEAEAKLVAAKRESLNTQQTIRNRETAQIKQDEEERKSAIEKSTKAAKDAEEKRKQALKDAAQDRVYATQIELLQAKMNGEETVGIQAQLIQRQGELEAAGLKANSKQRKYIEAKTASEIEELWVNSAVTTIARLDQLEQDGIKTLLANVKKGTEAGYELNQALIRSEAEQQKDQARATIQNKTQLDAQLRRIDAETKQKLTSAEEAFIRRLLDVQQQRVENEAKISKTLLDRFNQDQQSRISMEQDSATISLAKTKAGSKAESDARLKQIEADRKAGLQAASESGLQGQALQEKFDLINAQADRAASDERIRRRNEEVDKLNTYIQASAQVLSNFLDAQSANQLKALDDQEKASLASAGLNAEAREEISQQFAEKREKLEKEAAERRQKLALVEAVIQTALAVVKASPDIPLMILAGATGLAEIATIAGQQFEDGGLIPLAKGGVVNGPRHAQGGVKYPERNVELEGGEGVLNRRSMSIPWVREMASRLNQVGGGVAFGGVGYQPSSRMEYGGMIPNPANGFSVSDIENIVSRTVANMPRPVVAVEDIRGGVNQVVSVENRADYGTH